MKFSVKWVVLFTVFLILIIAKFGLSKKIHIQTFKDRTDIPQNEIEIDDKKDQITTINGIPAWALKQNTRWGSRFFFKRAIS